MRTLGNRGVSPAVRPTAFFALGPHGVEMCFESVAMMHEAREQIVLGERFAGSVIGKVSFVEDASVVDRVTMECRPNVVRNREFTRDDGRIEMHLKMFNEYAFIVESDGSEITIRHQRGAPVRLLVDDVFHLALQQLLAPLSGFILHGACVAREGKAVVFMGMSGAGKSSTAFNLSRFGFQCYADDATIVVPRDGRLWTWQLSRELSIRPLTFNLFAQQGIKLEGYTRDEGKYYFQGRAQGSAAGAVLEHLCFVEVNGELDTTVTRVSEEEALARLLRETRNFAFPARDSAPRYSQVLARAVPSTWVSSVGMDLQQQGRVLSRLLLGDESIADRAEPPSWAIVTRHEKLEIIRRVWGDPGPDDLRRLVPLLGDVDPKALSLAFASLQTLPLAQLEPIGAVRVDTGAARNVAAPWLHAEAWRAGARELVQASNAEVLRKFAHGWMHSAPLLYPFLHVAAVDDAEKLELITDAWAERSALKSSSGAVVPGATEVHIADCFPRACHDPAFQAWWSDHFQTRAGIGKGAAREMDGETAHVYLWLSQRDEEHWTELLQLLETMHTKPALTIVPVVTEAHGLGPAVDFVRFARARGWPVRISRNSPLCMIDGAESRMLLAEGALEANPWHRPTRRFQYVGAGPPREQSLEVPLEEIAWPGAGPRWQSGDVFPCATCGLESLGICRGGFTQE